jgi:hypothetical protein
VAVKRIVTALLLGLFSLSALAPRAHAHALSTSYLHIEQRERGPQSIRWDLSLHDLVWTVFIDADYDGLATWQEVQAARPAITAALLAQLSVKRGGEPCALHVGDFALADHAEQHYLSVAMTADCAREGLFSVGGPLFLTGDASQRVLLSVIRGDETLTGVLSPASPAWEAPVQQSAWASFVRFVGEGIWHVAIGYDHVAFVLLLLLPSVLRPVEGQWRGAVGLGQVTRDIVTIITAFTIAHSITLALAVTKTVELPAKPIEIAIAASIALAGALNLVPRLSGWRLPLAFGFGFVHGFGFANALSGIDAGGVSLLPLLGGFNIGVEIAQLGIVAIVLPLIYLARGRRWYSGGVLPLGSCALGAAGLVWVVQRL